MSFQSKKRIKTAVPVVQRSWLPQILYRISQYVNPQKLSIAWKQLHQDLYRFSSSEHIRPALLYIVEFPGQCLNRLISLCLLPMRSFFERYRLEGSFKHLQTIVDSIPRLHLPPNDARIPLSSGLHAECCWMFEFCDGKCTTEDDSVDSEAADDDKGYYPHEPEWKLVNQFEIEVIDDDMSLMSSERSMLHADRDLEKVRLTFQDCRQNPVGPEIVEFYVSRESYLQLDGPKWIGDEIIDRYLALLNIREKILLRQRRRTMDSLYLYSFFFGKLLNFSTDEGNYNYKEVQRWTKRVDVFMLQKVFIPVNIKNCHWALVVINMQAKEIVYYDSLFSFDPRQRFAKVFVDTTLRWLSDEAKFKQSERGRSFNSADWTRIYRPSGVPQQTNGNDCGLFTICCADSLSNDLPLGHSQDEMHIIRLKVAATILEYPQVLS